jgi:hypothetical protein
MEKYNELYDLFCEAEMDEDLKKEYFDVMKYVKDAIEKININDIPKINKDICLISNDSKLFKVYNEFLFLISLLLENNKIKVKNSINFLLSSVLTIFVDEGCSKNEFDNLIFTLNNIKNGIDFVE